MVAALIAALMGPAPLGHAAPPEAELQPDRTRLALPDAHDPDFARKAMEYVDDLHRGEESHGVLQMTVKTKHWTRTLEMESWTKGKDYSLVKILSPKKERGTATLKAKDELFTYLNKTGRTIKVTGGMMGASWMGSHFTNDDLVRETRLSDDFKIEKTYSGTVAGIDIHVFTLTPHRDAAVVWGKIEVAVRAADLQPLRQVFYDEDQKPVRELVSGKYEKVSGRLIPTVTKMRPLDGSGEYTQVSYVDMDFDVTHDESMFSLQNLKSL